MGLGNTPFAPIPGLEGIRLADAQRVRLPAGELNDTLDAGAIGFHRAQVMKNCRTDRGIWEIDQRYRKWNKAVSSTTARDVCFWRTWDGEVRVVAVANDATDAHAYHQDGANIATQVGTTDLWVKLEQVPLEDDDAGTVCWEHEGRLFIAGGPLGYVYYVEKGDPTSLYSTERLYRDYSLEIGGDVQPERPPYTEINWADATTLAVSVLFGGSIVEGARASGKSIIYKYRTAGPTNRSGIHRLVITQTIDFTDVDAFYLELRTNSAGDTGPDEIKRLITIKFDDGTNTKTIKYKSGDNNILILQEFPPGGTIDRYFVDMLDVHNSTVDTSAVTIITIEVNWNNHSSGSTVLTAVWQPGLLGGRYMVKDLAAQKLIDGSPARTIQYAYRYIHNSGSPFTNWTHLELPGPVAIGDRPVSSFPHMGAWHKIEPIIQNTGTFDRFEVARRASDNTWYDISAQHSPGNLTNEEAPTGNDANFLVDKWTDVETIALGSVPGTDPDVADDPFDPADSGPVEDVENGFSWKGCNIYLTSSGQVQMSATNDFKLVLWDNVDIEPLNPGSGSNPRVVQVTSKADPFLAGVGADAAYCFTRSAAFVFVGPIPAFADGPWKLTDAKGVVGKRAVAAYRGGALYAADDGLYLLMVPPNFSDATDVPPPIEMTQNVRAAWADLFDESGTDKRAETVVVVHQNHIWVYCRKKILHMHPDGRWVTGSWADSFVVVGATADAQKGVVLIGTDLTAGLIGQFSTDGGTAVDGTGGTAPEWTYRSGTLYENIIWNQVEIDLASTGTPNVRLKLTTDQGSQSAKAFTSTADSTKPIDRTSNSVHNRSRWADFELVGKAIDKVRSVVFEVAPAGRQRGRN